MLTEEVIAELLDELGHPRMTEDGQVIEYLLVVVNRNVVLRTGESLGAGGVVTGDFVRLTPSRQMPPPPPRKSKEYNTSKISLPTEIDVLLSVLDLNRCEPVSLPLDREVADIIRQISVGYRLQSRDSLRELITYRIESKSLGRFLGPTETLSSAGIPRMDRLTLHREEVAG